MSVVKFSTISLRHRGSRSSEDSLS